MYVKYAKDIFDKENNDNLKMFAKRIKKEKRSNPLNASSLQRRALKKGKVLFRDITNRGLPKKNTYSAMIQTKINKNNFARKVLNHNVYLEDNYTVADTPGLQKTNRYTTLNYSNLKTKRIYKFYCFRDKDLAVPSRYSAKTISHTIDNDCNTDDGQIKGAIIKLYRNMEKGLKKIKEDVMSDQDEALDESGQDLVSGEGSPAERSYESNMD